MLGLLMVILSAFVLSDSIKISRGLWLALGLPPQTTFLFSLLIIVAGLVFLFYARTRRTYAWGVWSLGMMMMLAGMSSNLNVYREHFPKAALAAAMLLFAGGMSMVLLSLRHTE